MANFIEIEGKLSEGVFERRVTRFSALVKVKGKSQQCFLPNPGRLDELLTSGAQVILRKSNTAKSKRETSYDIVGVYKNGAIVSVDSRLPNKLVFEVLKNRDLPEFSGYKVVKPEYRYGHARFDFLLRGGSAIKPCLLEVKSCTLVRDGVAMFPDAPTERGARHVLELAKALDEGFRATVLFIIQRSDAKFFTVNDGTDPKFGEALLRAVKHGLEVYAYSTRFAGNKIILNGKVKIML
ncbi:MAG: DNA/RNA nuclease SfsA [Candidatus Bathyarchaeia archaeon]|nr:DNA/RNA nuclease SfsA [Candidatus Bathyarchaeota archaeon]